MVQGNDMIKMSSSILDYIFRELAISYLARADLGHVNADDLAIDAMGTGEKQSDIERDSAGTGFFRQRNIVVLHGSGTGTDGRMTDTAPKSGGGDASAATASTVSAQIQHARMQGYEGENCPECGNFTLVRNGTCLKCNTCGATTGCS